MSKTEFKRVRITEVVSLVDSRIQHFEQLIQDWKELKHNTEVNKCQAAADELKRLKVLIRELK